MLHRQRVGQSESERSYISFLYKSHKVHKHSEGKKNILKLFNPHFLNLFDHKALLFCLTSLGIQRPTVLWYTIQEMLLWVKTFSIFTPDIVHFKPVTHLNKQSQNAIGIENFIKYASDYFFPCSCHFVNSLLKFTFSCL